MSTVNKFDKCPNCNENWDGGDIYEVLAKMDVNSAKSPQEILKLAAQYGWTPESPKRFSNTNTIEISPTPLMKLVYYECPSCKNVYESLTGKHYTSINQAKNAE